MWALMYLPGSYDRHVYPVDDTDGHRICEDRGCPCGPSVEPLANGDTLIVHNAWDCRECVERAEKLLVGL